MFDLVETNADDEILTATSIRFLLAFNLRFDYPHENPIMLTLLAVNEQISCRILIERLIMLFNRSGMPSFVLLGSLFERLPTSLVDPIEKNTGMHSVVKFFADLFGDQGTISDIILSDSDRRLIIEIISREVSNRSCADEVGFSRLPKRPCTFMLISDGNGAPFVARIDSSTSVHHTSNVSTHR